VDKEELQTESQAEETKESEKTELEPAKKKLVNHLKEDLQSAKRFIINKDNPPMYEQRSRKGKSGKKILVISIVLVLLLIGGYFINKKFSISSQVRDVVQPTPIATPASLPTPTPVSKPVLNRSDWSLEILNGTDVTGAARQIANEARDLNYLVVKIGNADKNNYLVSQILVRKELEDQIELVIADLRDVIKIASIAGELKEGTASARIIIGEDNI